MPERHHEQPLDAPDDDGMSPSEQQQEPVEKGDEKANQEGEGKESTEETTVAVETEYPPEFGPAAVLIQAAWRGFSARKAYEEEQVTRQWAAVKVQSFFRARRARRAFSKNMRCVVCGWVNRGVGCGGWGWGVGWV